LRLIPWGVESDIFKPIPYDSNLTREEFGISPKSKIILCPRGISKVYNIDIVLEAFRQLIHINRDLILILLHYNVDKDYLLELEGIIHRYHIDNNILWLPTQDSHKSMARLYRLADIMISIPSSEGYGFSVYEAIACDCPTIISDLQLFDGKLEHKINTIKVPIRDIHSTREALNILLNNPKLRNQIRSKARELINEESVKRRINLTQQLYEDVIHL
jgi:glycosyltransferase involved in cell wall biosynthesis